MTREEALRQVQIYAFALKDTELFLDTHPSNADALTFYGDTREKYREAAAAYEAQFGPLRATGTEIENGWSWVETPWPWEMEE